MKLVIGTFEFEGRIGIRGWHFFANVPHVGQMFTSSDRPGPVKFDYQKERGNVTVQAGPVYLTFDTAAEVRRCWDGRTLAIAA